MEGNGEGIMNTATATAAPPRAPELLFGNTHQRHIVEKNPTIALHTPDDFEASLEDTH